MKKESSGAEAIFMKRAPEPELCHFYDVSAALLTSVWHYKTLI